MPNCQDTDCLLQEVPRGRERHAAAAPSGFLSGFLQDHKVTLGYQGFGGYFESLRRLELFAPI